MLAMLFVSCLGSNFPIENSYSKENIQSIFSHTNFFVFCFSLLFTFLILGNRSIHKQLFGILKFSCIVFSLLVISPHIPPVMVNYEFLFSFNKLMKPFNCLLNVLSSRDFSDVMTTDLFLCEAKKKVIDFLILMENVEKMFSKV